MPGLREFLLTALVVAAVWFALRWKERRQGIGKRPRRQQEPRQQEPRPSASSAVEDLEPCPRCGDYVPRDTACPCDRTDCPYA